MRDYAETANYRAIINRRNDGESAVIAIYAKHNGHIDASRRIASIETLSQGAVAFARKRLAKLEEERG